MEVIHYPKAKWDLLAEDIHALIFEEHREGSLNRIDFALVAWNDETPVGYITCRETDSESVYIGYGGVFPESRNSQDSKIAMDAIIDELSKSYKRANMLVENTNVFMLKKSLNTGFIPVGITNYCGSVYVDLRREF